MNGDPTYPILIIPEYEAQLWYLTRVEKGEVEKYSDEIARPESRKKMDNAFLVDLDGDGDLDIATTEENGGWGVIWFEGKYRIMNGPFPVTRFMRSASRFALPFGSRFWPRPKPIS